MLIMFKSFFLKKECNKNVSFKEKRNVTMWWKEFLLEWKMIKNLKYKSKFHNI